MRPMWIPNALYEALPLVYIAAGVLQLLCAFLIDTGPRALLLTARRRVPDRRPRRVDAPARLSRDTEPSISVRRWNNGDILYFPDCGRHGCTPAKRK